MKHPVTELDAAYVAGVIDCMASITTRTSTARTRLPMVQVSTKEQDLVSHLCEITGVSPVQASRMYARGACTEHCQPDQHVHTRSVSYRWFLTGEKAVIVLRACLPYMHLKGDLARWALAMGAGAPFKAATRSKMAALGWPVTEEENHGAAR